MKKLVRILSVILCLFIGASMVACSPSEKIDKTKTQLYVGVYRGGIGEDWLYEFKSQFQELYKDISIEEGKKGIEVIVRPYKDEITGVQLLSTMPSAIEDVYFTQDVDFAQGVAKGVFEDITDIVTEKYDTVDIGEGEKTYSIEDKIEQYVLDYFKINGKYYGLPFAAPVYGMMYDVDLFAERNLYYLENGKIGGSIDNPDDVLSAGPDGEKGTFDDGLPSTWNELIALFDLMISKKSITPINWSGQHNYQRNSFTRAVWANYEGFNDYIINNTLNGTLRNGTVINDDNAYLLVNEEGRMAAAKASYDLVKDKKYFYDTSFYQTYSNVMAMEDFLISRPSWDKPIAMILEGGYWENEAKDIFKDVVDQTSEEYARENRRFSYMPVPKFIGTDGVKDQTNDEQVLVSTLDSLCFINAASSKKQLAKDFIKFVHTNASLSKFNSISGVTRAYKYKMTKSDYDHMSYYQKSVYDMAEKANFKIVQGSYVTSRTRKQYNDYFKYWEANKVSINRTEYDEIMKSFNNNPELTPAQWFNSFKLNYNSATWANKKLP